MKSPKKILISAGEPSGDLHASSLIRSLKELDPDIVFTGIGCDKMEALGVKMLERMDRHSIIGVWEVVKHLSFIRGLFKKFENLVDAEKFDLAILVDYPGFNLELAKRLHKSGVPCVYYITPQVWAWGAWRIRAIKKYIKKALTILPFEADLFKRSGIDATFVGHPLLDVPARKISQPEARKMLNLAPDLYTLALLPGSRPSEVKNLLPAMIGAVSLIQGQKKNVQIVISKSPNVDKEVYGTAGTKDPSPLRECDIGVILSASDLVITASGTVTLEVALYEKPMVITYITAPLTYALAKIFVTIRDIGLVNILRKELVAPELVQANCTPKKIAAACLEIISSVEKQAAMKREFALVKESLGTPGASRRAANIIYNLLKNPVNQKF